MSFKGKRFQCNIMNTVSVVKTIKVCWRIGGLNPLIFTKAVLEVHIICITLIFLGFKYWPTNGADSSPQTPSINLSNNFSKLPSQFSPSSTDATGSKTPVLLLSLIYGQPLTTWHHIFVHWVKYPAGWKAVESNLYLHSLSILPFTQSLPNIGR